MKFGVIDPSKRLVAFAHAKELHELYPVFGLAAAHVDHATAMMGVAIVVTEYGLFMPPDRARYFSIGRRLYAGAALLYGFNYAGETIDLETLPTVAFYADSFAVEAAIRDSVIDRPAIRHGDQLIWKWPEPKPDLAALAAQIGADLGAALASPRDDFSPQNDPFSPRT